MLSIADGAPHANVCTSAQEHQRRLARIPTQPVLETRSREGTVDYVNHFEIVWFVFDLRSQNRAAPVLQLVPCATCLALEL